MQFEELSEFFGETKIVKLSAENLTISHQTYIRINSVGSNYIVTSLRDRSVQNIIRPIDNVEKNKLDILISKPYIAKIYRYKEDAEIQAITYTSCEAAELSIFLSEKSLSKNNTFDKFKDTFKNNYYFECGNKRYCVIGRHKRDRNGESGFVFCRNGYCIPVKSKRKSDFSTEEQAYINGLENKQDEYDFTILYAEGERPNRNTSCYIYTLAEANIEFFESLKNMAFASEALTFAKTEGIGAFLKRWGKYNEEEHNKWEQAKIDAGILTYISRKKLGNNYELEFDKAESVKRKIDNFIGVMNDTRNYSIEIPVSIDGREKEFVFEVVPSVLKKEKRFIIKPLHDDYPDLPKSSRVSYSIAGYKNQYNNRNAVFELILDNECKMKQLPMLLSGKTPKFSENNIKHYEAITDRILREVFDGNPPNEMQRKAVETAINTPDWAIIQGPPGTGKTTVISAIAQRLNDSEISKKNRLWIRR